MKLASWNVNGLRACMNKGFADFFRREDFDIFAIQETKMQPGQAVFDFSGYEEFWNSAEKKGYSGTLVLTKKPPISVQNGMGIDEHDREGRIITLEFEKYFFVNVYTPNSQRGLARLEYRMCWEEDFREWLAAFDKPIILCGDLNVAHTEMDIKNARSNVNNAGFTPQEREKMSALLAEGFIDTFRALNPEKRDAYTWWSYMGRAREKNVGWRIDYFLISENLRPALRDAAIYPEIFGSDHCPVSVELEGL